jgi:hypothetical protein
MTYERRIARVLLAADPARALAAAARDRRLPPALRRAFAAADVDGVRLSALLVARLRFERLLRGDPAAERWFEEDPAGFAAAFRAYHAAVAPSAFFPAAEAALFRAWRLSARPAGAPGEPRAAGSRAGAAAPRTARLRRARPRR